MKIEAILLAITLPALCGCDSRRPSGNRAAEATGRSQTREVDSALETALTPVASIEDAFENHRSNIQILAKGAVTRLLPDDITGDKHQRMILELANGHTLLVAHNIDIAERVPASVLGGTIYVHGEYEWNPRGGVVHWTHHDPTNAHAGGWIQYKGVRYE